MAIAIIEFPTREILMRAAAAELGAALEDAIKAHGSACAALSGGSTPEPAYRALAKERLDWRKVTFALVDERYVPPTHPASNEGLVRRTLAPAFGAGAQFKAMYTDAPSVEHTASTADALYASLRLDIALMGMGDDGHTASWFLGAAKLAEALDRGNPRTVIALNAPQAAGSADRLTLTRAALARARRVLLLLTGTDKRARLEAALADDGAPVAALFDAGMPAPDVLWAA
jgi:6-phosphogluconolactonase